MFQQSTKTAYYSKEKQRQSFGDSFSFSQPDSFPTAYDDGSRKKPTSSLTTLEPGCLSTTVCALKNAIAKQTGVYGGSINSPLSLVGWLSGKTIKSTSGCITFNISDGTGTAVILLDIQSDNESWLLIKLQSLLEIDNNEKYSARYLRVIGMLSTTSHDNPDLRAIHVRLANFEEIAFFHNLSCVYSMIQCSEDQNNASQITDENEISQTTDNPLSDVELPESHNWCKDYYEVQVLKYILKFRNPPEGVIESLITEKLPSMGCTDVNKIKQAIESLKTSAAIYTTTEFAVDVLLEDD